jgi:hypothetical protein
LLPPQFLLGAQKLGELGDGLTVTSTWKPSSSGTSAVVRWIQNVRNPGIFSQNARTPDGYCRLVREPLVTAPAPEPRTADMEASVRLRALPHYPAILLEPRSHRHAD